MALTEYYRLLLMIFVHPDTDIKMVHFAKAPCMDAVFTVCLPPVGLSGLT